MKHRRSIVTAQQRAAWSRREFIRVAGLAASALALPAMVPACGDSNSCDPDAGCLPTLGGAPDTEQGRIIAAFVDTVVPGRHRDPQGRLGGIDVDAPAMFFDPELPAVDYTLLLSAFLTGKSKDLMGGRTFTEISPAEREIVLDAALVQLGAFDLAIQLVKLAFYSSPEVHAELGYPGPNPGYIDDPELSFGVALSTEITSDGNLP